MISPLTTDSIREKIASVLHDYRCEHGMTQEQIGNFLSESDLRIQSFYRIDALGIDFTTFCMEKNAVFLGRIEENETCSYLYRNIQHFFYSSTSPLAEYNYRKLLFLFILYLPIIPPALLQDALSRIGGSVFGNEGYVLGQIQKLLDSVPNSKLKFFADLCASRLIYFDDPIKQDLQISKNTKHELKLLKDGAFDEYYHAYCEKIRDRFNIEDWIKNISGDQSLGAQA